MAEVKKFIHTHLRNGRSYLEKYTNKSSDFTIEETEAQSDSLTWLGLYSTRSRDRSVQICEKIGFPGKRVEDKHAQRALM
jgi:hypothetical protein